MGNKVDTIETTTQEQTKLWNPVAALIWSVFVFTPVFGAWIHAKNWKTIGDKQNAKKSMYWAYGGIAILLFGRVLYLPYLIAWYFIMARKQMKFVKNELNNDYEKKPWKPPVKYAVAPLIILLIIMASHSSDDESSEYDQTSMEEGSTYYSASDYSTESDPKAIVDQFEKEYYNYSYTIFQILPYEDKALVYSGDNTYLLYSKNLDNCVDDQRISMMVRKGDNETYETANGSTRTVGTRIEVSDSELEAYREAKQKIVALEKEERLQREQEEKEAKETQEREAREKRLALISNNSPYLNVRDFSREIFFLSEDTFKALVDDNPVKDELEKEEDYNARLASWETQVKQKITHKYSKLNIPEKEEFFMRVPAEVIARQISKRNSNHHSQFTACDYDVESEKLGLRIEPIGYYQEGIIFTVESGYPGAPIAVNFRGTLIPDCLIRQNEFYTDITIPLSLEDAKLLKEKMGGDRISDVRAFNNAVGITEFVCSFSIETTLRRDGGVSVYNRATLGALVIGDK